MNKVKVGLCLLISLSHLQLIADEKLESDLRERCKASFKIIENKDLAALNKLMPASPSEKEIEHNKKFLEKKYKEWFEKSGGITEIQDGKILYGEASKKMKKRYSASQKVRVKFRVLAKNYNMNTSCTFIQTSKGWFLSKLP